MHQVKSGVWNGMQEATHRLCWGAMMCSNDKMLLWGQSIDTQALYVELFITQLLIALHHICAAVQQLVH